MSRERVTGGEAGNKRENIILKMIEQEKRINDTIEQLVEVRADIRAKIELVSDDTQRLLLVYRYIDHMTWESIAEKMKYNMQELKSFSLWNDFKVMIKTVIAVIR